MTYFWGALILSVVYMAAGFPLINNYSPDNARLLLKTSVFYLPGLFGMIIVDKIV